jgi:hypothetical protein
VPSRGKRDLVKEKFWRHAIDRFTDSGKSRAQFCKDENLKPDLFFYWLKVIKARDAESHKVSKAARKEQAGVFAEVTVAPEQVANSNPARKVVAEAVFSGGSLLVFENADFALLKHLIQALKESSS